LQVLAEQAPCLVSVYPNAGLPDQMGEYRETPEVTAKLVGEFMRDGLVNIVGGCCGTTPEHIAALSTEAKNFKPRPFPASVQSTHWVDATDASSANNASSGNLHRHS
ncbi:MAG TPA: homocysteine S-methyltransferase family protein, partial [Flavobacteriales bacterium]|nr:homocysteine S-methyltransferase family protein [Flavobacteriales bacterium]